MACGCFGGLLRRRRSGTPPVNPPWALPAEGLVLPTVPQTLGLGTHGAVLRGMFQGTPVAVKPMLAGTVNPIFPSSTFPPSGPYCSVSPPAESPPTLPTSFSSSSSGSSPTCRWSSDDSTLPPLRPTQGWSVDSVLSRTMHRPSFFQRKRQSISQFLNVLHHDPDNASFSGCPLKAPSPLPSSMGSGSAPPCSEVRPKVSMSRRKEATEAFQKEVEALFMLHHQNVLPVLGVMQSPEGFPLLLTELMETGTLHDVLYRPTTPLSVQQRLAILQEVADGLTFLHQSGIFHANLHARKVLLDRKLTPKITGFGRATLPSVRAEPRVPFLPSSWLAPELLRLEAASAASDVYAFGLLMYETLAGQPPYGDLDAVEVAHRVAHEDPADPEAWLRPTLPVEFRVALGSELAGLMEACWHSLPTARPTMRTVQQQLRCAKGFIAGAQWWDGVTGVPTPSTPDVDDSDGTLFHSPRSLVPSLLATPRARRPRSAETFPCITCVFADVVGFSTIAGTLSSTQTVELLAALFTKLDVLTSRHGLHCVDVIGDAYMAVCGLHDEPEPQQVAAVCRWCDEAVQAAHETLILAQDPARGTLRLRCGVHSGPCTAAVVSGATGHISFFGDTINVASRMESLSSPDCTQLSERAADALAASTGWPWVGRSLQCRGPIAVKGKGTLVTYWLI